jgi:hypothetical protein
MMGLQERFDGFAVEVGGGGCLILSRYIDGGGFVWITCRDGGGLPDLNDWLVVAYGADVDKDLFQRGGDGPQGLFEAIGEAVTAAKAFVHPDELCRNGWPMADCDCC